MILHYIYKNTQENVTLDLLIYDEQQNIHSVISLDFRIIKLSSYDATNQVINIEMLKTKYELTMKYRSKFVVNESATSTNMYIDTIDHSNRTQLLIESNAKIYTDTIRRY